MEIKVVSVTEDSIEFEVDDEAQEMLITSAKEKLGDDATDEQIQEYIQEVLVETIRKAVEDSV